MLVYVHVFELTASPASQVVKGPSVPTYGSPACWPAGLAQPPGVWRDVGQWSSPLIFGPQHVVHFDMLDHEEWPDDERGHGKWDAEHILGDAKIQNWKTRNFKVLPLRWTPQVHWRRMGDWHDHCLPRCSGLEGHLTSPRSLPVRIRGKKCVVAREEYFNPKSNKS